jgi:hypothetical protein
MSSCVPLLLLSIPGCVFSCDDDDLVQGIAAGILVIFLIVKGAIALRNRAGRSRYGDDGYAGKRVIDISVVDKEPAIPLYTN